MKNRITKEFRSVVFANAGVLKPETFEKLEFYIPTIVELKDGGNKAEILKHVHPRFVGLE